MYESQTNEHILLKFLTDLHAMLDDKTVWGGHLGSETLIRKHKNTRTRIACITVVEKRRNELELKKMKDDTTIDQLPEECVREILCKLSDHRDVENAGSDGERELMILSFFKKCNFRKDHSNNEIYCVREENLERIGAGTMI